jgi:hypothetical protein
MRTPLAVALLALLPAVARSQAPPPSARQTAGDAIPAKVDQVIIIGTGWAGSDAPHVVPAAKHRAPGALRAIFGRPEELLADVDRDDRARDTSEGDHPDFRHYIDIRAPIRQGVV